MVGKVTARYVVVRSLDGVEAIVPNETLVTTTVLNHSYSGIWKAFQGNGIKIAYPRREVRLLAAAPAAAETSPVGVSRNPVALVNKLITLPILHYIRHRTLHRNKTV